MVRRFAAKEMMETLHPALRSALGYRSTPLRGCFGVPLCGYHGAPLRG
jgi:hypothetical protein